MLTAAHPTSSHHTGTGDLLVVLSPSSTEARLNQAFPRVSSNAAPISPCLTRAHSIHLDLPTTTEKNLKAFHLKVISSTGCENDELPIATRLIIGCKSNSAKTALLELTQPSSN